MYRYIASLWGYTYEEISNMTPLQQFSLVSQAGDKTATFKTEAEARQFFTGRKFG